MSSGKWTVMTGAEAKSAEGSVQLSEAGARSRFFPFDPASLPFDHRKHTAVEMARAEKGGNKKSSGCCGGSDASGACTGEPDALKSISVSLGIGLFRFMHKGVEFRALHQQIGDPVGTGSGAQVLKSLVLFKEGTGADAKHAIQAFLAEVLAESEKTAKNTFQVYRWHVQYQFWQRVSRVVARPVSSVVLPDQTAQKLVEDFSEFLSEETARFYQEHGIPYKRSYLFYGVPGAGKTSMIQALAGKFGRNLCYLSPTHPQLTDDSLKSAIERVPDNAIVVLEDVDALFGKNREKKVQQSPLTFSGLLNALDGVGNHDGLVFVLSTNFKEQLDAALIRDGRVDMRVRFDYCTPDQMEKLFENFYPQCKTEAHVEAVAAIEDENADPEIVALELKLAALKKAKAAKEESDKTQLASGAAFRDALLLSLGDRQVSTAQLQHFFVTHRKCSPAEAIAAVGAIAAAIDERLKEEGEHTGPKESPKNEATLEKAPDVKKAGGCESQSAGKTVHVHVHTANAN